MLIKQLMPGQVAPVSSNVSMKLIVIICSFLFFSCSNNSTNPEEDGLVIGHVTDIDGNIYKTVKIGDQWWMAENLNVTKYRNGDDIYHITDYHILDSLTTGAYSNYNSDTILVNDFGRLYNWFAVIDTRNIAPNGWHIPSDEEWKTLEIYLGMDQSEADGWSYRGTDEGGKLKITGTLIWDSPNSGATNETGFSALPSGKAFKYGYRGLRQIAYYWSTTENESYNSSVWTRWLSNEHAIIGRNSYEKYDCYSVRCIKD